jgi:hypothetical protein
MSTLQPVNLGPKKPPVAEVIQEKEPILVVEENPAASGLVGSPPGSEGTAVELELGALSIDGSAGKESSPVVEAVPVVPVLGPPVDIENEEVKK